MNRQSLKLVFFFLCGMLTGFLIAYLASNYKIEKKADSLSQKTAPVDKATEYASPDEKRTETLQDSDANRDKNAAHQSGNIDDLTEEKLVTGYVKVNKKLPDYYITKREARSKGWVASEGNLCDVLPGRAIGGDPFSNREKTLPTGRQYFEADVNYKCGRRNADRIVFTKNGEVWLTKNHYKTFQKQ